MSDDFQPLWEGGEADGLPADLARIYRQLEYDGTAWSRRVPDTTTLEDFVITLAAGKDSQPLIENRRKGSIPMKVTDDYIDMPMDERTAPAPLPAPRRPRSFIAPVAAVLLVILLAAVFVWRAQHHATTPASATATPLVLPANATVLDTTLLTGDDIWGVGATFTNPRDTIHSAATGFVVHYSGGHWHMVDNTDFPNISLMSIRMLSDTEGWAIGRVSAGQPTNAPYHLQDVVYHFVNGAWSKVNVTIPADRNVVVQPLGSNDVWLLTNIGNETSLRHYTDGAWNTVATPVAFDYFIMLSATEGWFGQAQTLWHYQNGQWHMSYSVAGAGPNKYVDIQSLTAPNDGWGLQYDDPNYYQKEGQPTLAGKTSVIHYDGNQWTPIAAPSPLIPDTVFYVDWVTMHTAQDGWATGIDVPNSNSPIDANTARYLFHYLNGTWTHVAMPAKITFNEIKMTSTTEGWAVGQRYAVNGIYGVESLPVILHYQSGAWNVVG